MRTVSRLEPWRAERGRASADAIQVDSRGKSFLDVLSDYIRRTEAVDSKGGN